MFKWVKKDLRNFGKHISESSDLKTLSSEKIDLAFIGAGLSSTFTLIEFIKQIENKNELPSYKDKDHCFSVVVFEKDSWIWGGIPYGHRSGFTSLIITPLDEFLPESELDEFIEWMKNNYDWLVVPFKNNSGERSQQWLRESEEKIKSGKSEKIHIPRYFFGIYIWEKLQKTLSKSSKNIKLDFVNAEVTSIDADTSKKYHNYKICVNNKINFSSNQILLGIGIPQIRSLDKDKNKLGDVLYFNDPYNPDLESSLDKIHERVKNRTLTKILIVGANASALEIIYQITNVKSDVFDNINFSVIAPQGKLPDLFIKDKQSDFVADKLQILSESKNTITADLILEALKTDLHYAEENNYDISDTLPVFTKHVGNLVGKLSRDEKFNFISFHGVEIGRLQRRAGQEYTQPINDLINKNKLSVMKGKFLKFSSDNTEVELSLDGQDDVIRKNYDIVINCSGSSGLSNKQLSPLLQQLKKSGMCVPTSSNHGFKVGDNFDVMAGFYINGPLLAGNVVKEMGIWHVEHCGRIISFAKKIAHNIITDKKFIAFQKEVR